MIIPSSTLKTNFSTKISKKGEAFNFKKKICSFTLLGKNRNNETRTRCDFLESINFPEKNSFIFIRNSILNISIEIISTKIYETLVYSFPPIFSKRFLLYLLRKGCNLSTGFLLAVNFPFVGLIQQISMKKIESNLFKPIINRNEINFFTRIGHNSFGKFGDKIFKIHKDLLFILFKDKKFILSHKKVSQRVKKKKIFWEKLVFQRNILKFLSNFNFKNLKFFNYKSRKKLRIENDLYFYRPDLLLKKKKLKEGSKK